MNRDVRSVHDPNTVRLEHPLGEISVLWLKGPTNAKAGSVGDVAAAVGNSDAADTRRFDWPPCKEVSLATRLFSGCALQLKGGWVR